ncbi:MAG: TonB-dependent receptor plug domain-containing protein, partial [Bacteroidales bacterium]|nr:TonB-dependent receptor plug domain-containing protein [Bacteroidales bacterium]
SNVKTYIQLFLLCFLVCGYSYSQDLKPMHDTLKPITVLADTIKGRSAGLVKIDARSTRRMVTALGEGDVIKYIQTLPGISTGVESSSSFYVRGGNLGNNVVTLDGVRLYGYGHLLGITSAFPSTVVKDVDFNVGGFSGESSNLLASHIAVHTKEGNFREAQGEGSVSNFMVGAFATAPIVKDKIAFVAASRISPLQLQYSAGKGFLEKRTDSFNDVRASVYDLFGKVTYKVNGSHKVYGEVFYSMDNFGYGNANGTSYDRMEWSNFIGNVHWDWEISERNAFDVSVSYNSYGSNQNQEKIMEGVYNRLGVESKIDEAVAHAQYTSRWGKGWQLHLGARGTKSRFAPGSSKVYGEDGGSSTQDNGNSSDNVLATVYGELEYRNGDAWHAMAAVRENGFFAGIGSADEYSVYNPEVSLSGSRRITKWMGMEATFDWLTQYYHTLEGIPLGWSLDMIVPSSRELKPESSLQYYGGLYFKFGDHRISAGAYYKELEDIIYFSEATDFFGSQLGSWKSYIEVGKGTSKGVELLYEKGGEKFTYKIAYTNSRTDRHFAQVNEGRIFLAKYDRPHVLNVQGDYLFIKKDESSEMGVNMMFTYQSGNMESVKSATYLGYLPGWDKDIVLDYYSGINNLRLKPYIRLDLGWYAKFKRVMVTHNVKAGIYNVLNRHNHFSLYYDSQTKEWKQVYIFPMMPSLSYSVEF